MMEATSASETSVKYENTRSYIPEDSHRLVSYVTRITQIKGVREEGSG
jgi:hypothetical protein